MRSEDWWKDGRWGIEPEGKVTPKGVAARMVKADVELERLYDELQLCLSDIESERSCRQLGGEGLLRLGDAVASLGAAGDSLEPAIADFCMSLGLETPNCIGRE